MGPDKLDQIRSRYEGKDPDVIALVNAVFLQQEHLAEIRAALDNGADETIWPSGKTIAEVITLLRERATAYLCAECHGIAYVKFDSLDCGTTFTCEKCDGKTVVLLLSTSSYIELSKRSSK